jgi:hypothetical protein
MPTERSPLLGEVVRTFADRGCCVVSATDPTGHILGFLDRSRLRRGKLNEIQAITFDYTHNQSYIRKAI